MVVQTVPDYEALSHTAAQFIAREIQGKPTTVLGLAAGNTPAGTYRELVRMHREEQLNFSSVVFFDLDEYEGLEGTHPQSFTSFLHRNLLDHIHVKESNLHLLTFPTDSEIDQYCAGVENDIINKGGIDLQILGIGRNGHIAFNEPGAGFDSRTRVVKLTRDDAVRPAAITLGIATILASRRILLLSSGKEKAEILAKALHGPVSEAIPASALQLHADVTVLADEASSTAL